MSKAKIVYLLYEKPFEQPTFLGFMNGHRVKDRLVETTTSKRKAEKWSKESFLHYYRTSTLS